MERALRRLGDIRLVAPVQSQELGGLVHEVTREENDSECGPCGDGEESAEERDHHHDGEYDPGIHADIVARATRAAIGALDDRGPGVVRVAGKSCPRDDVSA